jgi:hypothetical protein
MELRKHDENFNICENELTSSYLMMKTENFSSKNWNKTRILAFTTAIQHSAGRPCKNN